MSDHHTYKKVEIVGSSKKGVDDAIRNAVREAAKSVDLLEWFEVTETRGHIVNDEVDHFQVALKIGFKVKGS